MNRFILDTTPRASAQAHCDKHVVKMIVEEAQMLSTVHHAHGDDDPRLYRPTHRHHPCTLWAGQSRGNYEWAWELLYHLTCEYTVRFGRVHATEKLLAPLAYVPDGVNRDTVVTEFPQSVPEDLRGDDPIAAYRAFYLRDKARFATWTRRQPPSWWPQPMRLW